jgi:hypothetical protein
MHKRGHLNVWKDLEGRHYSIIAHDFLTSSSMLACHSWKDFDAMVANESVTGVEGRFIHCRYSKFFGDMDQKPRAKGKDQANLVMPGIRWTLKFFHLLDTHMKNMLYFTSCSKPNDKRMVHRQL